MMGVQQSPRNVAVMYIRVLAMLFIFIDHAIAYTDMPLKNVIIQITNSGNLIFLFISGFLYGGKTIENFAGWLKSRIVRLWIPYICFVVVYFGLQLLQNGSEGLLKPFLIYSFMLQGLLGTDGGPLSLWFMTLLLICYCFIPLLQKIRTYDFQVSMIGKLGFVIAAFVIQVLLAYFNDITLDFGHPLSWYWVAILVFALGYFMNRTVHEKGIPNTLVWACTAAMIPAMIIRLVGQKMLDESILYDRIISIWSNAILDVWIIVVVYFVVTKYQKNFDNIIIRKADYISYAFYLVHATVLEYCARFLLPGFQIQLVLIGFVLSALCAAILQMVSKRITRTVTRKA